MKAGSALDGSTFIESLSGCSRRGHATEEASELIRSWVASRVRSKSVPESYSLVTKLSNSAVIARRSSPVSTPPAVARAGTTHSFRFGLWDVAWFTGMSFKDL